MVTEHSDGLQALQWQVQSIRVPGLKQENTV